jgi:hypothetical protein
VKALALRRINLTVEARRVIADTPIIGNLAQTASGEQPVPNDDL